MDKKSTEEVDMTAVIGILNKEGAAIAADSAVTMTRGLKQKIAYSANKMLRLSNVQPIGVMIYSNALFMNAGWDLIIRWYRTNRGEMNLPTLEDYVNDFLEFLTSQHCFCNEEQETVFLSNRLDEYFTDIDRRSTTIQRDDEGNISNMDEVVRSYAHAVDNVSEKYDKCGICPQFESYSISRFEKKYSEMISEYLLGSLGDEELCALIQNRVVDGFYRYLRHRNDERYSGLVFTGYGEKDIYPSLICVRIMHGFDGHLAYYINPDETIKISDEYPYAVMPFAQTDVIQTLVNGVAPNFRNGMNDLVLNGLESLKDELDFDIALNREGTEMPELEYPSFEDLALSFNEDIDYLLNENRKTEFYNKIKDLSCEEMAKLADCMVSITAIKRHINFDEEGVGGLVDLAIITRDKGFKWLNRKCWYDAPGSDGFNI